MASSKRPTYKVETKLPTERKRRHSDLVIMWQSICGVTAIIIKDLWITLLRMWEFIQLWFSSSERVLIQTWLEKYLCYVPDDFSESWRDGRLLAILLNKLRPGCFPDANRLDPDYGLKNVYRVFDALDVYFGIKPNVSVEEIVTCIDGSDSKLLEILLQLKNLTDNNTEHQDQPEPEPNENNDQCAQWQPDRQSCITKGAGLAFGFVGKVTNFVIFCSVMSDLDVVVEIRGPNSICSERITKRSPKKKHTVSSWECARLLTRSVSFNEDNDRLVTEQDDNFEKCLIPLQYEIIGNQINLSYKPKEKGKHKVTILWHGQHVSDSPYFVTIEDPSDITGINSVIHLKPALKTTNECGKNETFEKPRKISVRFQDSEENCKEQKQKKHSGKILSRRVLRYIVKIHGKDIPVNAENTESLATELLKMDYDFEKCPSFHRRNSWGFAGDAERKKSVIRQFGVDAKELDAQISHRRSRSLSLNPGSKKPIRKSDSFESLASNLNIVSEDTVESEKAQEKEEDYAYLNPDANEIKQTDEVENNDVDETLYHSNIEAKTSELSPELTESKFVESFEKNTSCEMETNKVSSLSTEPTSVARVDNSDRDLETNSASSSSVLKLNEPNVGKLSNFSLNYQCSSKKLHHEERENAKNDSELLKDFQLLTNKKTAMKNSKRKNPTNENQNRLSSFKGRRIKRKTASFPVQTFYKKATRNKGSEPLSAVNIFRKRLGNTRQMLKTKETISSKVLENLRLKDSAKSKKHIHTCGKDVQNFSIARLYVSHSEQDATSGANYTLSIKEQCIKNTEEKKLIGVDHYHRNIIPEKEKTKSICKASGSMVRELKAKKLYFNCNLNTISTSLPNSKIEIKDENIFKTKPPKTCTLKSTENFFIDHSFSVLPISCKKSEVELKDEHFARDMPLRTHTLKAIQQFNFKQFNPSFETQSSISPIKAQIGQWESSLSSEKQNVPSQKICMSDTDQVNFKEKLAFWENAYKTEQKPLQQNTQENNRKLDLMANKKSCNISESNSAFAIKEHNMYTGTNSRTVDSSEKEKTENFYSINKETSVAAKQQTDDKISAELQLTSTKTKIRSFSDPVILETAVDVTDVPTNLPCLESSTSVYSSSSTDDNLEYYDSDNSEDSGGDYILQSTEDEYIDDEISESASEYWGNMSIVKGWKVHCINEYPFLEEEFLQSCHRNTSHPEQCKVFGIAVYYGHVAVKNRFQVYTGDAGFGNLSVSMQGFRRHEVSLVIVAYVRNDIYEVTYQVMTAGYYLISIRWMDKEIPGSPFVCKVTF